MDHYTLITGASSGIGRELALIAAQKKRNLVLVARDLENLKAVKREIFQHASPIRSTGRAGQNNTLRIEILAIDLSKPDSAKKVYEFCEKKKIFVNELINNAGFGDYGMFARSNLATQLRMIDLNIRSVTELTHLFLPSMVANKTGRIMNLGSVASFLPGPLMSVYFASKNYILSFSQALSEELSNTGVTVTCLCPGSTKTSFGKNAHVSKTHSTSNPKTTAEEVAEFGWYHMQRGTRVAIYGWGNRLTLQITKFVPRRLLVKLVRRIQR